MMATKMIPSDANEFHGHDAEYYLLRRAGFDPSLQNPSHVILCKLECSGVGRNATYDPFAWGGRTYPVAHQHIINHFDELSSGSVIDVEFILGETTQPKQSERITGA